MVGPDKGGACGFVTLLPEKERIALYNAGRIATFSKGDILFRKDKRTQNFCLVLNGSFGASDTKGQGHCLAFESGDLIFERSVFDAESGLDVVAAVEPSRVLFLNEGSLNALGSDAQTEILKRITHFSDARMLEIKKELAAANLQRASVTRHLVEEFGKRKEQYEHSDLILNLIKKVPRLPIHVTQLIAMLLSEKVSTRQVTELAKQDPSLVSEVLKEVNSVHYGIRQKISDLYYAIMLIGFNEVYQIVVASGLRRTMPASEKFREVHSHSLILSYIALEVCQLYKRQRASLLGTVALLHDIGKSTVFLIEEENPKLAFFAQLLDPCKMGAMLLRTWNIPDIICETIEYQNFPRFSPPSEIPCPYREPIAILYFAHSIYDCIREEAAPGREYPFLAQCKDFLGLGDKSFDMVTENVMKNLKIKLQVLPEEVKKFVLENARS